MKFQDAVAVITGAAGGLGRSFAERILQDGGRVFITDVQTERLNKTGEELTAKFGARYVAWARQDVVEPYSFQRVFDEAVEYFGQPINLLINNAGLGGDGRFWSDKATLSWEKVIAVNLTALMRGTQVGVQHMKKHLGGKEGVIVNVSSYAGLHASILGVEYGAAKHGVVGFTRSCQPLKKQVNIRVVCLAPAFTNTAMGQNAQKYIPKAVEMYGGIMEVDKVVTAFELAVEDETNPGRVVSVVSDVHTYYQFPGDKLIYGSAKL